MFLLVPAYPGCPGSKAGKLSLLLLLMCIARGFAKRTLLRTARKAGLKTKDVSATSKRHKYSVVTGATPPMSRRAGTLSSSDTDAAAHHQQQQLAMFDDDLSGLSATLCLLQTILKSVQCQKLMDFVGFFSAVY